jgi:hypothetical protein
MRRIARRNVIGAALLVAVAVAVAGCGGSSKSSSPPTVPPLTVTSQATTAAGATTAPATTPAAPPTTTPAASSGSTTSSSGGSTGSSGVPASCLDFAGAASKVSQAFSPTGPTGTDTAKLKSYYLALADKAPSSIKSSFVTLANVIGAYLDQIKGLNLKPGQTPSADAIQKIQKATAALQTTGFQQATKKIQAWVSAGCH